MELASMDPEWLGMAERREALQLLRQFAQPDETQSLLKCVFREVDDYGAVSEETMQAIELYLQRTLPPGAG